MIQILYSVSFSLPYINNQRGSSLMQVPMYDDDRKETCKNDCVELHLLLYFIIHKVKYFFCTRMGGSLL